MRYETPVKASFQVSHRKRQPMDKLKRQTFPVTTIVLIPEMKQYLADPLVLVVDERTVIRCNSIDHRKYMASHISRLGDARKRRDR